MFNKFFMRITICMTLACSASSSLAATVAFEFTFESTWTDLSTVQDYTTVSNDSCGPNSNCVQWAEITGYMLVNTNNFLFKAPDYTSYTLANSNAILGLFVNVTDYQVNIDTNQKQLLQSDNYGLADFKQLTFSTGNDQLNFMINLCSGQQMQPNPNEDHSFCSPTGSIGAFNLTANNLDNNGNPTQAPTASWAYEMKTKAGTDVILTSMIEIPEPSTLLLLASGIVYFVGKKRHNQTNFC